MIETGKHSAFEGPLCNKDYHNATSISRYCIGNAFAYSTASSNVGPSKQLDSGIIIPEAKVTLLNNFLFD